MVADFQKFSAFTKIFGVVESFDIQKIYCKNENIFNIVISTIMVFRTGNGWLGTPIGGWEPQWGLGTKKFPTFIGYAVTHMVLYV